MITAGPEQLTVLESAPGCRTLLADIGTKGVSNLVHAHQRRLLQGEAFVGNLMRMSRWGGREVPRHCGLLHLDAWYETRGISISDRVRKQGQ